MSSRSGRTGSGLGLRTPARADSRRVLGSLADLDGGRRNQTAETLFERAVDARSSVVVLLAWVSSTRRRPLGVVTTVIRDSARVLWATALKTVSGNNLSTSVFELHERRIPAVRVRASKAGPRARWGGAGQTGPIRQEQHRRACPGTRCRSTLTTPPRTLRVWRCRRLRAAAGSDATPSEFDSVRRERGDSWWPAGGVSSSPRVQLEDSRVREGVGCSRCGAPSGPAMHRSPANHGDGTHSCIAGDQFPGSAADRTSMTVRNCPHHQRGLRRCPPSGRVKWAACPMPDLQSRSRSATGRERHELDDALNASRIRH